MRPVKKALILEYVLNFLSSVLSSNGFLTQEFLLHLEISHLCFKPYLHGTYPRDGPLPTTVS